MIFSLGLMTEILLMVCFCLAAAIGLRGTGYCFMHSSSHIFCCRLSIWRMNKEVGLWKGKDKVSLNVFLTVFYVGCPVGSLFRDGVLRVCEHKDRIVSEALVE